LNSQFDALRGSRFNGTLWVRVPQGRFTMTTRPEDLAAWHHAIALAAKVYAATRHLPSDERLGLVRELRRAALSVPSRIAEGAALGRRREFVHCLEAARGALSQLQTRLAIAVGQELIDTAACPAADVREVSRELDRLICQMRAAGLAAHARACSPLSTART
jgi:four helix bundle protein